VVAALAVAACASEESQWQAAESAATVDAYQEFLAAYPESAHRTAAEARIAFLQAEADNTSEAYRQYLADYPDGRDGAVAEERLAALEVGSEIGWCAHPEDADREFEVFVARRDTTLSFDDLRSTFRWDESVGLLWKWREGELAGGRGPGGSIYALSRETVDRQYGIPFQMGNGFEGFGPLCVDNLQTSGRVKFARDGLLLYQGTILIY
jgi:hypothetical protein